MLAGYKKALIRDKSLSISAAHVVNGFKKRRSMWIIFAQQEALIVHKTYQDLLKDCSVRWTTYRCYVRNATIQKLKLKGMNLSKTEVEALKNYFDNTTINVSMFIKKLGLKKWKEIQSVLEKLYEDDRSN